MVDLEALETIATLTYPARAPIIREAITELRTLRELHAKNTQAIAIAYNIINAARPLVLNSEILKDALAK